MHIVLKERSLLVLYGQRGDGFAVAAVESVGAAEMVKDPTVQLADHAHDMVASELKTEQEAREAGETYARKWLRKHNRMPRCGCGTIGKGRAA